MKNILILPEYWSHNYIGACGWIRLLNPLLSKEITSSFRVEYAYSAEEAVFQPDVVVFERLWHPKDTDLTELHRTLRILKDKGLKIIYSIDDNLFDYPLNQKSEWWLPAYHSVMLAFFHFADRVVVSTPALKERLSALHPQIKVIPNVIALEGIRKPVPSKDDTIRFGYLVSPDNTEYLYTILEPLRRVLTRYKNRVTFEIAGHTQGRLTADQFRSLPVQFTVPPDTAYQKYTHWLTEHCRWDFGLAPITKNEFTRCKSDMKFLDFTRLGIPGLYTGFTPYDPVKEHRAGGIVEESWEDALICMIEDQPKRAEWVNAAIEYVAAERNPKVQTDQWKDLLNELL